MIEVTGLTKRFGKFTALNGLDIQVPESSVYGLVGPNGSGKTTLIKHLTGVYRPDSGTVLINGEPVDDNISIKSSLVYIPDDLYFFFQYSIRDMARFYSGIYPDWDWQRYEALKEVFPLDDKKRLARLSKGMQRQAAFWLGICTMPQTMVLDEPVDGLDPVMRRKVWNLILQDVAQRGTTVLVSSHNLRELEDVCDHVGIMHHGKVMLERSLSELQGSVCKIQVAYQERMPKLPADFEVLHMSSTGRVYTMIVKGNPKEAKLRLEQTSPMLIDVLPLTLEEIFIYELGGADYAVKDILL